MRVTVIMGSSGKFFVRADVEMDDDEANAARIQSALMQAGDQVTRQIVDLREARATP
jgi:hypothetical protein